ncbi:MAG TPA: transglycosylase SLT domain-containing protein [Gemmatimonadaceae bacterium]|nr:transglycosylase SLT domain-containing protein [Gemmatimonadaceae bacterium]
MIPEGNRVTPRASLLAALAAILLVPSADAAAQRRPDDRGGLTSAFEQAAESRRRERDLQRYDPIFRKYAKRYFGPGIDWRWFKAQSLAESDLNPNARSRVGARGLMQLMPSTYRAIASRRPEMREIDDPEWNIAAGIMHDRYLWTLWKDGFTTEERFRFMFGSYNAGQGTIYRARDTARVARLTGTRWQEIEQVAPKVGRWRYTETIGYVRKIEKNLGRLAVER